MSQTTCCVTYGSDGICSEIHILLNHILQQQHIQTSSYYCDYCYYANDQSQQLTYAHFTTPTPSKFVMLLFNIEEIQQCQWSKNTQTSLLYQFSQIFKTNSLNCSTNTGFNYRWVPTLNQNSSQLEIMIIVMLIYNNFYSKIEQKFSCCKESLQFLFNIYQLNLQPILNYDGFANPQYFGPLRQQLQVSIINLAIKQFNKEFAVLALGQQAKIYFRYFHLEIFMVSILENVLIIQFIVQQYLQNFKSFIKVYLTTPNQFSVTSSLRIGGGTTTASQCENTYVNFDIANLVSFLNELLINKNNIQTNNFCKYTTFLFIQILQLNSYVKIQSFLIFVTTNQNNNICFLCSCKLLQFSQSTIMYLYLTYLQQLMLLYVMVNNWQLYSCQKYQKSCFNYLLFKYLKDCQDELPQFCFWFLCNMQFRGSESNLQISMLMQ
ncbi:unnamed protein product [Paramecium pentaurelia]|uniref:Uncharacterized protein n=1 Tax=Paramecium pentaurelia TaxID=43138 RepID=A0A8S1U9H5_9CILI|nr:unnamed protein product [Paramecium pentaurelia]